MARARKPDNVHLLQGTHQPCRHGNPDEKPKVEIKIPSPPESLSGVAHAEWLRICDVLKNSGILSDADIGVMAIYCELYAQFQTDPVEFPAAKYTQLRLCMVELGMTPAARSKITVGGGKKENTFADV